MKHREEANEIVQSAQNPDWAHFNDFEAWLGYEFWSSQVEVDIEQEMFDLRAEEFISPTAIMETWNPYQITRIADMQKERRNDALPF